MFFFSLILYFPVHKFLSIPSQNMVVVLSRLIHIHRSINPPGYVVRWESLYILLCYDNKRFFFFNLSFVASKCQICKVIVSIGDAKSGSRESHQRAKGYSYWSSKFMGALTTNALRVNLNRYKILKYTSSNDCSKYLKLSDHIP